MGLGDIWDLSQPFLSVSTHQWSNISRSSPVLTAPSRASASFLFCATWRQWQGNSPHARGLVACFKTGGFCMSCTGPLGVLRVLQMDAVTPCSAEKTCPSEMQIPQRQAHEKGESCVYRGGETGPGACAFYSAGKRPGRWRSGTTSVAVTPHGFEVRLLTSNTVTPPPSDVFAPPASTRSPWVARIGSP